MMVACVVDLDIDIHPPSLADLQSADPCHSLPRYLDSYHYFIRSDFIPTCPHLRNRRKTTPWDDYVYHRTVHQGAKRNW